MTIEHVVVLMLENRSFDCMLGKLYPNDGTFDGLTGQEFNVFAGRPVPVWSSGSMDEAAATIPKPDPGELFLDMTQQLFAGTSEKLPPPMKGFAANYMNQPAAEGSFNPQSVMHYYTPEQVPVISALARAFGVCDQWYASAPCQTWPNRFFAHTATALGCVDNSKFPVPFPARSLFRTLSDHDLTWRVYFHDVPQSLLIGDIWLSAAWHYRWFDQFLADAAAGALCNYSFIEPRYFTNPFARDLPNDQHPPHNVLHGERLIAQVYNAVRQSPCWEKSLLIVTCDEHGGCYDHMPPPTAVPPDDHAQDGFAFDRYGVRVPAVIVSPFISAGTKIRSAPQGLPHNGPPYPFDHTSIIATVRKLFGLGASLTARDAVAPDLLTALKLTFPANDGPASIPEPAVAEVSTETAIAHAELPTNHMQTSLARMARSLPLDSHMRFETPLPAPMAPVTPGSVATLGTDAVQRVRQFLNI